MTHALALTTPNLLRAGAALLLSLTLAAAAPARAAPPPGHPSPGQARELLAPNQTDKELRHEGKVLRSLDANEFSYVEVSRAGAVEWLAAPLTAVKPGSTVRFEEGSVMAEFYSKLLQRSFASIRFVGAILVTAEP